MQGKYEENPIFILYDLLNTTLGRKVVTNCIKIDPLIELMLLNNGCKVPEHTNVNAYQASYDIIPNEYKVYFISGMIGNDVNDYYDFLSFNGLKILVIFLDYFHDITYGTYDSRDPMVDLKVAMGNSVYYDAIKKIVEVFYLTSEPTPGGLLATTMAATQRWNQAIIAIHILNSFKPIDENDVSDISMEDIKKILDGNIKLQLYGIRTM